MTEQIDARYFTMLRRVTACERTAYGIELRVDDERLRIDILADDLIRLKISRGGVFDEEPTFAVCADLSGMAAHFQVAESAHSVRIQTARMTLIVGRDPFRLDAYRNDGSAIFETADVDGLPCAYASLNDAFLVARRARAEDSMLGLGQKTGRMNRNGRDFTLWNLDVLNPCSADEFTRGREEHDPRSDPRSTGFDPYYVSIPFWHHLAQETGMAAGFFVDNGYRGRFEFDHPLHYRFHFTGGQYTEYVFAGPSLPQIVTAYTALTGRMSPPSLWALGYHQCRWHPYAQSGLETLATRYRESRLPCDGLWLDIDYMDGYRVFTWNKAAYPDVPAMLARLGDQGFRVITIIDPGVKAEPGYEVYEEGLARDVFCKTESGSLYNGQVWPGKTVFPDFVQESARRWWGERNAAHLRLGLAGIWNDMNEPATGDIPSEAMRFGGGQFSHAQYHNQYALLMAMGTQEGLLRAMPDRRTFILTRAGSAGIQRYAAHWLGDNMSRWDHLAMSVPMSLGLGLSGQPFVGADIGGFGENCTGELLARWMQCGVLTPFCRNHNEAGNVDQYPWSFGAEVESLCRSSLEMRYRLMPMLYSAFWEAAETGLPVMRPLVLDHQNDEAARNIDDQYLLGRHLLVAPVTQMGQVAREVYLPEGTWHHWFTGEALAGRQTVTAETPLGALPIYARGGAVIPIWPEAPESTMNYQPGRIELHLFVPEADGEWTSQLHEDDGQTFAYRTGAYYRTEICVRRVLNRVSLTATTTGSGYPEFAREGFTLVMHGPIAVRVLANGRDVPVEAGVVHLDNTGQPFYVEMDFSLSPEDQQVATLTL